MQDLKTNNQLVLKFNTEELSPTQIRLLKSISTLLTQALTSDEESEYFDLSAELMKKTAEVIKHSNFAEQNKGMDYGTQAVEFAIDFINESLDQNKIQNFDN